MGHIERTAPAEREANLARLRSLIASEQCRPGERLGSERGLAEILGVSRSSLRGALEILEARGEIRRSMGRSGGVFVSDGKIERTLNTIQGVSELLRRQGIRAETTVLRSGIKTACRADCRRLGVAEGQPVWHLVRRRDADGIPWSLGSTTIAARRVPSLAQHDLTGGVYRLLQEEYGITLARAAETIDVVNATEEQSKVLGIVQGSPLFELRRIAYDTAGQPVEAALDYFRADRTRITFERVGARWKRRMPA